MGLGTGEQSRGWSEDRAPVPQLTRKPQGQGVQSQGCRARGYCLLSFATLLGSSGVSQTVVTGTGLSNAGLVEVKAGKDWRQHHLVTLSWWSRVPARLLHWHISGIRLGEVFAGSQTRPLTGIVHAV